MSNGGSAFPVPPASIVNEQIHYAEEGMTLRDYFAAKAMQSLLSNAVASACIARDSNQSGRNFNDEVAVVSWEMADAMIKARGA